MVIAGCLMAASIATRARYHDIGACVICRVSLTTVAAAARSGLTWLVLQVVVVGWMFGVVGCHATVKGSKLSCEID